MTAETLLRRGLKLRHLQLLAQLHDSGHLGLAADRLGMAQPAASRLLAEIEGILGQPVHERLGRGTALTEVGRALALRAGRVLLELSEAEREIAGLVGGSTGHVRIGSVIGPALDRVLPALQQARLDLPEVTAEVVVLPSDLLCAQLLAGRLDFVLGRVPPGTAAGALSFQPVAGEPVDLIVRRGHPLTTRAGLTPPDLLAHDWVMPGPEAILGRTVAARLAELGLPPPERRLSTASFLLTLAMVRDSDAIAPLARAAARSFAGGPDAPFALLPVDLGIEVEPFGLITRRDARLPPVAGQLAARVLAAGPAAIAASAGAAQGLSLAQTSQRSAP